MGRIRFYARTNDMFSLCEAVERQRDLTVIPAFSVETANRPAEIVAYKSVSEISHFGKAASGYPPLCQSDVLIDRAADIQPKTRFAAASRSAR